MNLYALCGLEPPVLAYMKKVCPPNEDGSLGLYQILALLIELNFPRSVFYGSLPLTLTWRDSLPGALASGCRFILGVQDIVTIDEKGAEQIGDADFEGVRVAQPHAVIPFATNSYGVKAVTGWPGREIEMFSWELYPTMPIHPWRAKSDPEITRRRGFARDFVMAHPDRI